MTKKTTNASLPIFIVVIAIVLVISTVLIISVYTGLSEQEQENIDLTSALNQAKETKNNYEESIPELIQEKKQLNDNINSSNEQLTNASIVSEEEKTVYENLVKKLEENQSVLEQLKSGDKYNLHDPLYDEAINFLDDDNSKNIQTCILNAKNMGIRCAFVILGLNTSMYTVVGFNTLDAGMIYFEFDTDWCLYPEIGKSYQDCFPEEYNVIAVNDPIQEIQVIW